MKNQFLRISFEIKLTFRVNLFSKIFSNKLLIYQEKKKRRKECIQWFKSIDLIS